MSALALVVSPIATVMLLFAFSLSGVATYSLGGLAGVIDGLPWPISQLSNPLRQLLNYLNGFARQVVGAAEGLMLWATQLTGIAFEQLWRAIGAGLIAIVGAINSNVLAIGAVLTLAPLPQIERDIPDWFRHIEDEIKALPNEPAFRSGGPLRLLLSWLSAAWSVLSRLLPFGRAVALPLLLVLGVLWGLVETIGRISRLEALVAGLVAFTKNLDAYRQADEARLQSLAVAVNVLQSRAELLQVDLERERAARVAALQQEQVARQAATTALEAQRQADRSQWSPLLILAVLAALGAAGVETLRKTAECDPCARIDQSLSDLPARVAALEAYGEYP